MAERVSSAIVTPALARLGTGPGLAAARTRFASVAAGLDTPMSVALVGRVSAGKSTLANALLGGYRAPTGVTELTFNVNWITHGPTPAVTVHFDDGRAPEPVPLADLEALTVRITGDPADDDAETARHRAYLDSIAYLRITDPAPYLASFDLIDTPGLDSVFGADSANTLRFLDGPVDAVVLVFTRGVHAQEAALLRRLRGSDLSSGPLNTLAVLTHVESYWDWPDVPDPFAEARRVVDQAASTAEVADSVYRLSPVASLVGAGAIALVAEDLAALQTLAKLPRDDLGWWIADADSFAVEDGPALDCGTRRRLRRMLGAYGVMLACDVLDEGADDVAVLARELDRRSGTAGFRDLLVDHFGRRADLVTLNRAYSRVLALPDDLGPDLSPRDQAALTDAVREFSRHGLAQSPRFRQLDVLRAHYEGRLDLDPDDATDLLRVLGETGADPDARLGLPAGRTRDELAAAAWAGLGRWADLDGVGFDGATRNAVAVGRRAYERLLDELQTENGARR